jgi:hypothetical protein
MIHWFFNGLAISAAGAPEARRAPVANSYSRFMKNYLLFLLVFENSCPFSEAFNCRQVLPFKVSWVDAPKAP